MAEEGRLHTSDIAVEAASSQRNGGFRIEQSPRYYIGEVIMKGSDLIGTNSCYRGAGRTETSK